MRKRWEMLWIRNVYNNFQFSVCSHCELSQSAEMAVVFCVSPCSWLMIKYHRVYQCVYQCVCVCVCVCVLLLCDVVSPSLSRPSVLCHDISLVARHLCWSSSVTHSCCWSSVYVTLTTDTLMVVHMYYGWQLEGCGLPVIWAGGSVLLIFDKVILS